MCEKFISVMNSIFSTVGVTGLCVMFLTAVTKMDFVDIGVISAIVGCYVGVTSFISLKIRWGELGKEAKIQAGTRLGRTSLY